MTSNVQTVARTHRPASGTSNVERVKRLLAGPYADKEEVRQAVHALSDNELVAFGLNAYCMNMLALFGRRWSRERVFAAAREAAISKLWRGWEYFHHYLPRQTFDAPALEDVPVAAIESVMAEKRGLVVATFHVGDFRYIASDLAIVGTPVCMPLAADALGDFEAARSIRPDVECWTRVTGVNAESVAGAFQIAKTLAAGGCVCASLDGNTGFDGPRGQQHRTFVDLNGCGIRVKNGLVKLAGKMGAPILPAFASTIDGVRRFHAGPLIDPGAPLLGSALEHFVDGAMRDLYAQFGDNLETHAGSWSGCDHFHLWRIADPARVDDAPDADIRLRRDLEGGGRVGIDPAGIVELHGDDGIVLADVHTMRCYRVPGRMSGLIDALAPGRGVDLAWIHSQEPGQQRQVWNLLAALSARGALVAGDDGARVTNVSRASGS